MEIKIDKNVPIGTGNGIGKFRDIYETMKKMNLKESFFISDKILKIRIVSQAISQCKKSIREVKSFSKRDYTSRVIRDDNQETIGLRVWRIK